MIDWINAGERLPAKDGEYLVHCRDGYNGVTNFCAKWGKFNSYPSTCRSAFDDVTHWAEINKPED